MFEQFALEEQSPCKAFRFIFLNMAQKFGQIEKGSFPKAHGSRMPLARAVYHCSVEARRCAQ